MNKPIESKTTKTVVAVALFATNRYRLSDIPKEVLQQAKIVYFCSGKEYESNKSYLQQFDKYHPYHSYIEDLEGEYTPDEQIELEAHLGRYELPNKQALLDIKDFINNAEMVVVACSAGIARSGATATWLMDSGYVLADQYNTRFSPNETMLHMYQTL